MHADSRGVTLVLLATAGFAFKGIFARLIYAEGLLPIELLAWRMTLAAPLFWLGLKLIDGRAPLPRGRTEWGAMGIGFGFALAALADFEAVARIGAGPSRVVLFTFPLFVLLFQAILDRRAPRFREITAFAVAWTGLALVAAPGGVVPDSVGIAAGLLASTSYAAYLIGSQPLMDTLGSARFTTLTNTGALASTLLALPWLAGGAPTLPNSSAATWLAVLVVMSTVVPFFALFEGIRRIGASRAGLLALTGPPLTVAAAWLLLGEQLTAAQLAGAGLVIVAVGGLRVVEQRSHPAKA